MDTLDRANELKLQGNDLFKASKWTEALVSYKTALGHLPPRTQSATDIDSPEPTGDPTVAAAPDVPDALDAQCAKARAVLYANIGACLSKLVS